MKPMNYELKKVVDRVKTASGQLQNLLKDRTWVDEAKKYADKQATEAKKLFDGDLGKIKTFLESERKELERFQKQIPGEVDRFVKFVGGQRKELEKLLKAVKKASQGEKSAPKRPRRTTSRTKTVGAKKKA